MVKLLNDIIYYGLYLTVYLVSILPIWVLYKLSAILYILLFYLFPYRKTIVIQNLSRSFPEKNYQEIGAITKGFYRTFCDNLVEILKTVSISPARQANKIVLTNFDILSERIRLGQHVIACMGHCGNWEILNILPQMLNVNCYAVYKPLRIKSIDYLFLKLRSRFGMQLIPSKAVVRHFISNKDNPSLYFFLADQCPKVVEEEYRFNLLHQQTSAFSGIEKLARSTNSAVVYIHVIKTSRGLYHVTCKEVSSDPASTGKTEITKKYISLLEENIQAQPSGWLWTHKRWKR